MSAERADDNHRVAAERFLRAVFEPGAWHEVRALKVLERKGKPYRSTATAYHDDPAAAAADAFALDALEAAGVYVTINPVDPACAARAYRRVKHFAEETTKGLEVLRRRWLLIDVDAGQQTGISATNEERGRAIALAKSIRAALTAAGWPAPIFCTTPNGAHLFYRIDLPNDKGDDLVQRVLASLGDKYDELPTHIDRTVFDANRIVRIPGTMGRKGDSTPERPHRRGELLDVPAELVPVSRELLEAVATPKPAATPQRTTTPPLTSKGALHAPVNASATFERYDPTPDGLRSYLERHGVSVSRTRADGDGTMLDLRECPIAGSAGGTSVSVRIGAGGLVTYHNLHNGGAGLTWADVREHLEPGYRAHSERMKDRRDTGDSFDALSDATTPANADEPEPWDTPIPFIGAAVLPTFPVEDLPSLVQGFVASVAESRQTPVDLPGVLALGILAAGVARKFMMQIGDSHTVPTNIYICAAMSTGDRKSPVFADTAAPLDEYERDMVAASRKDLLVRAERRQIQEHRLKSLRAQAAKDRSPEAAEAQRQAEAVAETMEDVPHPPRYIVRDSTPEALSQVLETSGGKITVLQAEGGGLFDILAGRYSGKANFDVWLHGYDEEELRIDRKGSPPVLVKRTSITAVITTQPEVIENLSKIDGARGRGLLARFLYSMPKSNVGYRPYKNLKIDSNAREAYRAVVRAVLSIPDPKQGESEEVATPYIIRVEGEALSIWTKFHDQIEMDMREGGSLAGIADYAKKLAGSAARIAGILHASEHASHASDFGIIGMNGIQAARTNTEVIPTTTAGNCRCGGRPEKVPVSAATMTSAWSLTLYFMEHAKAAFGIMAAPEGTTLALRILKWINRLQIRSFTQHECYRALQPDRVADLALAFALLEEHYFIRPVLVTTPTGKRGRPTGPEWNVNPSLHHAEKVKSAT
jgi:hypothetical protein